jgi:beta-1,4-mannosyltransferase
LSRHSFVHMDVLKTSKAKCLNPMDKFVIYAYPASPKYNPYVYLIYNKIREQGYPVYDYYLTRNTTLKAAFTSRCKIFHMHWPSDAVLRSRNAFHRSRRVLLFFLAIRMFKLLGKKLVWTVHDIHDLNDHEDSHPRLKKAIDKLLYNNVDGFISLNKKSLEVIKKKLKPGSNQKVVYISHPHYREYYPNRIKKEEARERLGIPMGSFVFLFIGQIREYKNIPALVDAFKALDQENTVLLIAGKPRLDAVLTKIKNHIGNSSKIKLYSDFVKDEDVQVFTNAADLVVIPYKRIFNSGSLFLNLSFNKPTLAPDMYAISELKDALGSKWVKTYKGEFSVEVLKKAMDEVKQESNVQQNLNLDAFDPAVIAQETIDFYQSLLKQSARKQENRVDKSIKQRAVL